MTFNSEHISPIMLWKDFDAKSIPLMTSVIKESEEDGLCYRTVYFNGILADDGKARIYGVFVYPKGEKKLPAILYLNQTELDIQGAAKLARDGYAVFTVDFCGYTANRKRYTFYPPSLAYANLDSAESRLFALTDQNSNFWLTWTAIGLRAITQLESFDEVDKKRIGALGIGLGSDIAYKIAAVDDRIKLAASTGAKNYMGRRSPYCDSETDLDMETSRWVGLVSPQSYAQHIKVPFFIECATNERTGSFDNIYNCYLRMPQMEGQYISVTERQDVEVGFDQRDNIKLFFAAYLKGQFELPTRPEIVCTESGGNICFSVKADKFHETESVEVFYSYCQKNPATRNWFSLKLTKEGDEYVAKAKAGAIDKYFLAFANVKYKGSVSISSRLLARTPHQMGIKASQIKPSRLLYDGNSKDCFFAFNPPFRVFEKEAVSFGEAAGGIKGVSVSAGSLATFKINDDGFSGLDGTAMVLNLLLNTFSPVRFTVYKFIDQSFLPFSFAIELEGSNEWQKVHLECSDFKNSNGVALDSWSQGVLLTIECECKIVVQSMIWV